MERTPGANAELVHMVLRRLADQLLGVAPVPLALDTSAGYEELSYLDGTVPSGGSSPDYLWTTSTLAGMAALLRRVHHATTDLVTGLPAQSWRGSAPSEWTTEVICHNDVAPWNTVFTDHRPAYGLDDRGGVIDAVVLRQHAVHQDFRIRSAAGQPAFVRLWEAEQATEYNGRSTS